MKYFFIIFIALIFIGNNTNAQIFHKGDSARLLPVIQAGVGGYAGLNSFILNPRENMQSLSGYDFGALIKATLNISRSIRSSVDIRYLKKNGTLDYRTSSPSFFIVAARGIQIPVFISYSINKRKKEMLSVSLGVSYNRMRIHSTFEELYRQGPSGTIESQQITVGTTMENTSGLFALAKTFSLTPKLHLVIFGEYELLLNQLDIRNIADNLINYPEYREKTFRTSSVRLGTYLNF